LRKPQGAASPLSRREIINAHLHPLLAVLAVWLIATSPWVSMFRRFPADPGFFDYAHIVAGALALLTAIAYAVNVSQGGRWKWFFPWAAGETGAMARDLTGAVQGRVPPADGPGLYGAIKGWLLLALLATALTGAAWFVAQGSSAAIMFRDWHTAAVRVLVIVLLVHVAAVASHLIELLRD
jgi:cytochrome b561